MAETAAEFCARSDDDLAESGDFESPAIRTGAVGPFRLRVEVHAREKEEKSQGDSIGP